MSLLWSRCAGKSLSLITACLYWLLEHYPREQALAVQAAAAAAAATAASAGSASQPSWVTEQSAAIQARASEKRASEEAILQGSITSLLRKQAAEEAKIRSKQATAEAARTTPAAGAFDPDADLLPTDSSASDATSTLTFAQQLKLRDLEENLAQLDQDLNEALQDPAATYKRKAQIILARVALSGQIATIKGKADGRASASSASGGVGAVDDLGSLLSKLLSPTGPPRTAPQIIYASRTHSQLIQFVDEIRKTKYGQRGRIEIVKPVAVAEATEGKEGQQQKRQATTRTTSLVQFGGSSGSTRPAAGSLSISASAAASATAAAVASASGASSTSSPPQAKVISLGSRSNLCINPLLQHLKRTPLQLNDVCTDMQKNKPVEGATTPVAISVDPSKLPTRAMLTSQACPYLDPQSLEVFHSSVLHGGIHDLEQLPVLGARMHFCPYYGTRNAAPQADVVVVPYASLLSATTRAALGINLRGAIIVVDEAHNVHDTINTLYSSALSCSALDRSLRALKAYRDRFQAKLKEENLRNLLDLIRLAEGFKVALTLGTQAARAQRARETEAGASGANHRSASGPEAVRPLDDFIGNAVSLSEQTGSMAGTSSTAPSTSAAAAAASAAAAPRRPSHAVSAATTTYTLIASAGPLSALVGISNINPHTLQAWVVSQQMGRKLKGFVDRYVENGAELAAGSVLLHPRASNMAGKDARMGSVDDAQYESSSLSPLSPLMDLVRSLFNPDQDGRVCIDIVLDGSSAVGAAPVGVHPKSALRFMMLNPSVHLDPILRECRTLILAGGTMQPFAAMRTQLFPQLKLAPPFAVDGSQAMTREPAASAMALSKTHSDVEGRLHEFSCGHVVPPSHIEAIIVTSGPPPAPASASASAAAPPSKFLFTHSRRGDLAQLDALGATIVGLLPLVPGGVVVFFTSYAIEQSIVEYWATHESKDYKMYADAESAATAATSAAASGGNSMPAHRTWLERMRAVKCIFREPRAAGGVDHVLASYTNIIEQATQAAKMQGQTQSTAATAATQPTPMTAASQASLSSSASSLSSGSSFASQRSSSTSASCASAASASAAALGTASFTDPVLRSGQTGALLFAVIGGKLSEGINFSDSLARLVIVVGMPYPSKFDPAMKEKMDYLNKREESDRAKEEAAAAAAAKAEAARNEERKEGDSGDTTMTDVTAAPPLRVASSFPGGSRSQSAGSRYLHTLCMRAVNQSIGRAIRHRGDYACIVLCDVRYTSEDVVESLPRWITAGPSFKPEGMEFPKARQTVSQFFARHRSREKNLAQAQAATNGAATLKTNSGLTASAASFASASAPPPVPPLHAAAPGVNADLVRKRKLDDPATSRAAASTIQRPTKAATFASQSNAK